MPDPSLLTHLLRGVSRSFYLTLRVLPASIRPQIGLAYLLARATDTIADTSLVSVDHRLAALRALQARIHGATRQTLNVQELVPPALPREVPATVGDRRSIKAAQTAAAERELLLRIDEAVQLLQQFTPDDQQHIRNVIAVISSGQELDLIRFAGCSAQKVVALATDAELDDYTYRVAGCVGEFWTHICRRHLFPRADVDDDFLLRNGVRFGKGLQLVNVLRDLPADLGQGRCYLPAQVLHRASLDPATLLLPAHQESLHPVLCHYRHVATSHLAAGWRYTRHLPWRFARLRLACAWPLLIGTKTLAKLERSPVGPTQSPAKINRRELHWILASSTLLYPVPWLWNRMMDGSGSGAMGSERRTAPSKMSGSRGPGDPGLGRPGGGKPAD
jgi:farnesyl-diphosphate farnesyltransferase